MGPIDSKTKNIIKSSLLEQSEFLTEIRKTKQKIYFDYIFGVRIFSFRLTLVLKNHVSTMLCDLVIYTVKLAQSLAIY